MGTRDDIATSASLALLLEVSATPKSGNVDRDHDFNDLKYEHFLASSVSAYRVFRSAAGKRAGVGRYIYNAVKISREWHGGGNVHFGAFLLLIPLVMASDPGKNPEKTGRDATEIVKNTTVQDSVFLARAYSMISPRVMEVDDFSLTDRNTVKMLKEEKISLHEWMKMAPDSNLIAGELTGDYSISVNGARFLLKNPGKESIIVLYHRMLAQYPDPLIISKHGSETAKMVMEMAGKAIERGEFESLDKELVKKGINPGTVADLTASSIFLALMGGYRI